MIDRISSQNINFTGKSFKNARYSDEVCDYAAVPIAKVKDSFLHVLPAEAYRSYADIVETKVRLVKKIFGFGVEENSKALPLYKGPLQKSAGFSTENGGYGGAWLKGDLNTPLSTVDVHTCAAFNLVDSSSNQHFLYHVYNGPKSGTSVIKIKNFIQESFPNFDRVNIIPGDVFQTKNAVDNILSAINDINPKAEKHFYHFSVENPEIVAHRGELSYIENTKPSSVSFQEISNQYNR